MKTLLINFIILIDFICKHEKQIEQLIIRIRWTWHFHIIPLVKGTYFSGRTLLNLTWVSDSESGQSHLVQLESGSRWGKVRGRTSRTGSPWETQWPGWAQGCRDSRGGARFPGPDQVTREAHSSITEERQMGKSLGVQTYANYKMENYPECPQFKIRHQLGWIGWPALNKILPGVK